MRIMFLLRTFTFCVWVVLLPSTCPHLLEDDDQNRIRHVSYPGIIITRPNGTSFPSAVEKMFL